jgi:hypothetical protein
MPWTPTDEGNHQFQITDDAGNVVDPITEKLIVGRVYEYSVTIADAPDAVQMRVLTEEQRESDAPQEQSHLLSVTAFVSDTGVTGSFTPSSEMVGASLRLGFVQDPTTLEEGEEDDAWGVGGIAIDVEQ